MRANQDPPRPPSRPFPGRGRYRRSAILVLAAVVLGALTTEGGSAGGPTIPRVGSTARNVNLRSVPGTVDYRGRRAVPLRGRTPGWFGARLARRVDRANGRPVAAPPDAPLPGTVGIRPGSWMIEPNGCTMNFIFRRSQALAIGTAGHCTRRAGQEVVLLTIAPRGRNPVLVEVGEVLKRVNGGIGNDFALVSIRRRLRGWVSPTIAVVAGPCGAYAGDGPETVWHYGHGVGIGTGGTPRTGVALTWRARAFGWEGLAIFGDSGSPVRVTGLSAAGNLTHVVVNDRWLPSIVAGTRIGRIRQIAGRYRLRSSSRCP